jgi:hypothetical protein
MTATTASDQNAYDAWIAADKNATHAAAALGISRRTLMRQVERHQAEDAQSIAQIVTQRADQAKAAARADDFDASRVEYDQAAENAQAAADHNTACNAFAAGEDVDLADLNNCGPCQVEAAAEAAAGTPAQPKTKVALPDGICTPVQFRHLLVREGLAPESLTTQDVYGWLKAKRNPFPVADANGRPGVQIAAGRAWYLARKSA